MTNQVDRCVASSGLRRLALALAFAAACGVAVEPGPAWAANPSGDLHIEIISAYNLVVDSNVESPSTYGPKSAYLGAKVCNDGANDMTNVYAFIGNYIDGVSDTPGVYPATNHPAYPTIVGPLPGGQFALTHEGGRSGALDATRYIGTLKAGECVTVYWLVSYPTKDISGKAVWGPSVKPGDDLRLDYDIWAKAVDAGVPLTATETRTVTMRNEISASANKIFPNTANKVPQEYQDLLQMYAPAWTNISSDGSPGSEIRLEGIWYDLGNVGEGFDNNGDLVPDHNLWMQPVGDPALFDPSCFRLVHTYVLVVVKLKSGGDQVYIAEDQLYFENVPENNGAIGYVAYQFVPLAGGCSGQLTPYQEVASGRDNEKFNGDYGQTLGIPIVTKPTSVTMDKSVDKAAAMPGTALAYAISYTNTGLVAVGNMEYGLPLVIQDRVPTGTWYVAGSATASNTPPAGGLNYAVFFSTNAGTTWTPTEPAPATNVNALQWWLSGPLPTGGTGTVRFSVTIGNPFEPPSPLLVNTGGLSFGSTAPFLTDTAQTLIAGTNRLGDAVFVDNGGTNGVFANGIKDGNEAGISNVTVWLYGDVNGNGVVDAGDPLIATQVTDANGGYLFTNVADGRFIAVIDTNDPDLPYGYTTTTPTSFAADLDSARTNANTVSFLTADFGFVPALGLTKTLLNTNTLYEGRLLSYSIVVTNNLPGDGTGVGGAYSAMLWVTNYDATHSGATVNKRFANQAAAFGAPDGLFATGQLANANELLAGNGFAVTQTNGQPTNVLVVLDLRTIGVYNAGDLISVRVLNHASGVAVFSTNYYCSTLTNGLLQVNVTGTQTWAWADFATNKYCIQLETNPQGGDPGILLLDTFGFRVTSDYLLTGGSSTTTLEPVPLTDTYNTNWLQFVSSVPPADTVTNAGATGILRWADLGPIQPGGSSSVRLTFTALQPPGNLPNTATNLAAVTNATYLNGKPSNTATSQVVTTLLPTGKIGDFVWRDLNGNGTQDVGEAGIGGVSVVLTPPANADAGAGLGRPVTNVTDSSGYYLFDGVYGTNAGSYVVTVLTNTLPFGTGTFRATYDEDGTNTPNTATFSFNPSAAPTNDIHLTADFGYRVPTMIEGTIWNDLNRNGTAAPDSGEDWLAGITVYLCRTPSPCGAGSALATNVTDTNGYFTFIGSYTSGTYTVSVNTNSGPLTNGTWVASYDTDLTNTLNYANVSVTTGNVARADFSYYQLGAYSIGDTLFYDWNANGSQETNEEGIAYITVYLYEDANSNGVVDAGTDALVATTVTDVNGYYTFASRPPGTCLVIVDRTDAQFPPLYRTTADPYGALDGRSVVTIVNASNTNQDFGFQPYGTGSIGDTVWRDLNADGVQSGLLETGITGVTVRLYVDLNSDGNYVLLTNTTTDATGYYQFANLPVGSYKVTVATTDPNLPKDAYGVNYVPTTTNSYTVTVTSGSSFQTADFGFAALGAAGDTIFWDSNGNGTQDANEPGISNAVVNLYRDSNSNGFHDVGEPLVASATTTNNGTYLFSGLQAGYYVIAVSNTGPVAGYDLTADPSNDGLPCSDTNAVNCDGEIGFRIFPGSSYMGADFGYQPRGVIGDTVWFDVNTNGVRDAGEPGMPYVDVVLYSNGVAIATNATDADGYYYFSNLKDGTYSVGVRTNDTDFPSGVTQVYDPDGTLNNLATNIVIAGGTITTVNGLPWTGGDLGIDFGYRYPGNNSLSGTVGMDGQPYDGRLGTGPSGVGTNETPFGGQSVYAYLWRDLNSNGVPDTGEAIYIASTQTDTNGDYRFIGLPNALGTTSNRYIVSVAAPLDELRLTTTNGATPAQWVSNTTNLLGDTISAYQVVTIATTITDIDFAFAPTGVYDYGDLPRSYSTLLQDNPQGARHRVRATPDLYLGNTVDTELNGAPTADATGDDTTGVDDEDGVAPVGFWQNGTNGGVVQVKVGAGSGWLCAYIDYNQDGDFLDAGELAISQAVSSSGGTGGVYTLPLNIPANTFSATNAPVLAARFRLFGAAPDLPPLAFAGRADDGEVEDYMWGFGVISDTVWVDANGNGVRDAGEAPLANVRVFVDANTNGVWDAGEPFGVTGTNGTYAIAGVHAGTYAVAVDAATLPANLVPSYDLNGPPDGRATVALGAGQVRTDVDFGYRGTGAIGDRVWLDENSDGVQDAGEAGIPNVRVVLLDTNGVALTTNVTDAGGAYLFAGLLPGTYTVRVDTNSMTGALAENPTFDPDATTNSQTTVTLTAGQEWLAADFGYNWAPANNVNNNTGTGAIGDRVWIDANGNGRQDPDEMGLAGVAVSLYAAGTNGAYTTAVATATTDANGLYIFTNLAAGGYAVVVNGGSAPAGYTQTGDPDAFGQLSTGDNRTTAPVILSPGDVFVNADFGYQPAGASGSIGGKIWFDANASSNATPDAGEYRIGGVSVSLIKDTNGNGVWDAGEPILATEFTDTNGVYRFDGLPLTAGNTNYIVWVSDTATVLTGLTPTYDANGVNTPNVSALSLSAGSPTNTVQDFSYTAAGQSGVTGLIGDTVFVDRNGNGTADPGEGLEGVTVNLYDAGTNFLRSVSTDENGHYAFGDLAAGTYVVAVSTNTLLAGLTNSVDPDGGFDSRASVTLTAGSLVNLSQDFGYTAAGNAGSISGTIWDDANATGVLDAGETNRYAGVTVDLYWDANSNGVLDAGEPRLAQALTDASGNYTFGNLSVDTGGGNARYIVDVSDAAAVLFGAWHTLGTNNVDNNSQPDPLAVTLSAGQPTVNYADFGYYRAAADLGNRVWNDSNDNGVQDAGEPGMALVTVTLTAVYPDGTTNVLVTRTDTNGYYTFGNLLLDEDYNGDGVGPEPVYVLRSYMVTGGWAPTLVDVGGNVGTNDWIDSDNHNGVTGLAVKGFVDVTLQANPATESAAAKYDFGYQQKPTLVRVVNFRAFTRDGGVIVSWETAEELGTVGFYLERFADGTFRPVNADLIPAQLYAMDGAVYEQPDAGAAPGGTYTYRLIEVENTGLLRYLGPYTVTVDGAVLSFSEWSRLIFSPEQASNPRVSGLYADPDGDGMSNIEEFLAGTDPLSAASAFRVRAQAGAVADDVVLRWPSASNRLYRVERAADLGGPFAPLQSGVPATPPENVHTDRVEHTVPSVYYRIRLEQ